MGNHPFCNVSSMGRSGSVLVWQLLESINSSGRKVVLTDTYIWKKRCLNFFIHRDPRDILCSYARSVNKEYYEKNQYDCLKSTYEELFVNLRVQDIFVRYKEKSTECNNIIFIKYEDYFNDIEKLFNFLIEKTAAVISDEDKQKIIKRYSIEENKKISQALGAYSNVDVESNIHGCHITNDGKIGSWKEIIPKELYNIIECELENLFKPSKQKRINNFLIERKPSRKIENIQKPGPDKLYLYHIMKCGGRSLFLSMLDIYSDLCHLNAIDIYKKITSRVPIVIKDGYLKGGYVFKHSKCDFKVPSDIILGGLENNFFFENSHMYPESIEIKPGVFTVTILRNPEKRLISFYRNLLVYKQIFPNAPFTKKYFNFCEEGWNGFVRTCPDEIMLEQVRMFSHKMDLEEAFQNIKKLSHIMFCEDYSFGLKILSEKMGTPLKEFHFSDLDLLYILNADGYNLIVPTNENITKNDDITLSMLRERQFKEYVFYNMVWNYYTKLYKQVIHKGF